MNHEEALAEIERLRMAIQKHRNARGHDRCWLNDLELYRALGEELPASPALPPRSEFLKRCEEYFEQQTAAGRPGREGKP